MPSPAASACVLCRARSATTGRLLGFTERTAAEMTMFAESQSSALSLLDNSCWAFAAALVDFCEVSRHDVQDT